MISSSPSDSTAAGPLGIAAEKNKQWQRELLMEKIRSHSSQHKTFQELSKSMRLSMLEKRYALDAVEKANLQKCLDSMQHCIKVTSRQGLVERLESLSRQLGLKFMEDKSGLFISTDMFYLEIILDANGSLTDVKVHHECKEQQSCSELVNCLNRGDFADFTVQLEGLSSIYQLNAEPKVKTKAFVALQAMETDLYSLFQTQNFSTDARTILTESCVGIALRRRGGHPMRLTYFVSPYDLISHEMKSMIPLTVDLVTSKNIGMSATVNLEASSANKLQILPTISFTKEGMTDVPVYSPLTPQNSTLLPATFVLRLNTPLPVCQTILRTIMPTQNIEVSGIAAPGEGGTKLPAPSSIIKLVIQTASENQLHNSSKGLFVSLPDQTHCYFFTENKSMKASIVSNVPFTEPSQVPKILEVLKKHALFYTLLSSCVRPQTKMGDMESTTILEVNAISFNQISVALEHPYEESMATVEFNLNDTGLVTCEIYSLSTNYESVAAKLTLIVQQSLSIPITIRSLLKYWDQERMKSFQRGGNGGDYGNFNMVQGPIDPGGRSNDFRDIKGPKPGSADRGGSLNGNFGAGNNRPFFHTTGITSTGAEGFTELGSSVGTATGNNSLIQSQFKSEVKQEDFCKSPKSNHTLQSDISSNDSSSLGILSAATQQSCSNSQEVLMFPGGVAATVANAAASGVAVSNTLTNTSMVHLKNEQNRSADIAGKYQKIWKDKTNTIKNTVSITPITASVPSMDPIIRPSQGSLEKRPGIEIIPLTTPPPQSAMPSAITITPINSTIGAIPTVSVTGVKSAEKKISSSGKRSTDDKDSKTEKKRKKKREDSPMGPPEKLFSRQNSPASDPISRKYSPQTTAMALPSTKPSPKHSPVYTSPKHASSSPKSPFGTLSPKHGSSGKPSMSTLKNATSPKSEKSTLALPTRPLSSPGLSSSKNREKDSKERLLSVPNSKNPTSPKVKSATIKLKPLDVGNHLGFSGLSDEGDRGRKSSLNAVIDKLKSSQNSSEGVGDKLISTGLSNDPMGITPGTPGSEYMVKPSQDGIKITINKTKTKDGGGTSSRSKVVNNKPFDVGNNSPKKHTGLKPGVNSGPASKKSTSTLPFPAAPPLPTNKLSSSSSGTKHNFQKSNSSGNLSTKLSSNSAGGGSSLTKSHSTNSFHSDSFRKSTSSSSNNKSRSSSSSSSSFIEKITPRPDPTDMMKILQFASPNMAAMEGFMKTFNTKFQIPKLSARNSNLQAQDGDKPRPISAPTTPAPSFTPSPTPSSSESSGNSNDSNKNLPKISGAAQPNKGQQQDFFNLACHTGVTNTAAALSSSSITPSPVPPAHFNSYRGPFIDTNNHASDLTMRPPLKPTVTDDSTSASSTLKNDIKLMPPVVHAQSPSVQITNKLPFHQHPASPSVSVHILKSPVPSPLVMPSPHSNSPCITDEELMDDTLVGVGSK